MFDQTEYKEVPSHILDALDRWGVDAVPPSGFCKALLENDLVGAVGRADPVTMQNLRKIVTYMNCQLPAGCHGSREAVRDWSGLESRGGS